MSSATFAGSPDGSGNPSGFCSGLAPPPPPPPPPVPGQMPAMKINTETPMSRRPQPMSNDPYEPPAAIQNAMMTKDKKPFTYTPGMGGKLDLSQIRSPRMARRVAKNANDEGIDGPPPKSPLAAEQPRPVSTGANLFIQPQVAVAVFPTGNIPSTPTRGPQINRVLSNASDRNSDGSSQPNTPESPTSPQVILSKAPTPWLQNKNKSQEELPEWAKRSSNSSTTNGSTNNVSPPLTPAAASVNFIQPVLQSKSSANPPRQQTQQRIQMRQPVQPQEHVVPLQVEDRPSVFTVINEPGHHHQFSNSAPNYQQRWGNPGPPSPPAVQQPGRVKQSPQSPGTYFVPMVVEGNGQNSPIVIGNSGYQQPQGWDYPQPVSAQSQVKGNGQQRGPVFSQPEPGPVQSRSFRVLQKITDTDNDNLDPEQLRKLQLTEDDKVLMNKFKEQVDGDTYLHQEEDPRYRGAAIPSRAFRYLQNMTDAGEGNPVSRGANNTMRRQNRNSQTFAEEAQMNLPASEQQVQEPKKYTGSAIPSRSFKILQAMTTPESVAKEESRQADTKNRSENRMMPVGQGEQQSLFIPRYPQPIYWAYYPIPYSPNQINYHHPHYQHYHQENIDNASPYSYYGQQDDDSQNIYPQTLYSPEFYPENIPVYQVHQELETEKEIVQDESNPDDYGKKIPQVNAAASEEKNKNESESDEGDSEMHTSESSELSCAENCQVNNEVQENSSSSESSDSDSYLAYSTGRTGLDEENKVSTDSSPEKPENDENKMEGDSVEKIEKEQFKENIKAFSGLRKFRSDTPNKIDESGWKDVPTDEEEAPTMVSLSLPFKAQLPVLKKEKTIEEKPSSPSKEIINSVSVSLKINKESSTTVDFTLRKNPSARPKSWCPDKLRDDFWTSETILERQGEANEPTEQTTKEKTKNEPKKLPSFEVTVEDDKMAAVEEDEEESADESKKNKYLLTVQNSRDETDDDDSGVTSDMSRLISEVDTDSECTPSRKAITYKRTQTHSRLFRLLSEDLSQDTGIIEKEKSKRRNRLSLPIKNSGEFSYDYSNQSSGITSPDYSPVYERPSCRNFQKIFNATTNVVSEPGEEDRYFKIWKNSKDSDEADNKLKLSSALAGKFEDKGSVWSHRSNVLCPRIKSTRSSDGRVRKPVVSTATSYSKYDRARKSEY